MMSTKDKSKMAWCISGVHAPATRSFFFLLEGFHCGRSIPCLIRCVVLVRSQYICGPQLSLVLDSKTSCHRCWEHDFRKENMMALTSSSSLSPSPFFHASLPCLITSHTRSHPYLLSLYTYMWLFVSQR
jgi:hypothetical protein